MTRYVWSGLLAVVLAGAGRTGAESTPAAPTRAITYLDSPRSIDLAACAAAWPALADGIAALAARDTARATALLERAAGAGPDRDGALNLLAGIYGRRGDRDRAWRTIGLAIRLAPRQHLHYFRRALLAFDQRAHSTFVLSTWTWHLRTKDAYEQALALAPRSLPYRYYVFYSYLNAPAIGGGDAHRALAIAEDGLALGVRECLLFRADARLHLGDYTGASADYDTSMAWGLFKKNLESYDAASRAAITRHDWVRARRWCDYMVRCRPDLPGPYTRLGALGAAMGDTAGARRAFGRARELAPVEVRPRSARAHGEVSGRGAPRGPGAFPVLPVTMCAIEGPTVREPGPAARARRLIGG